MGAHVHSITLPKEVFLNSFDEDVLKKTSQHFAILFSTDFKNSTIKI